MAVSIEIAKPRPEFTGCPARSILFVLIAELMPMTSPLRLIKGPPEFPGLIAASVWIIFPFAKTPPPGAMFNESSVLPNAEMMPCVMVPFNPWGLPMAITV